MAMIKCPEPECGNTVPDQAAACPKCGHPVSKVVHKCVKVEHDVVRNSTMLRRAPLAIA